MSGKFYDCWFVTPFWCTFDTVASKKGLREPSIDWMIQLGEGGQQPEHLHLY